MLRKSINTPSPQILTSWNGHDVMITVESWHDYDSGRYEATEGYVELDDPDNPAMAALIDACGEWLFRMITEAKADVISEDIAEYLEEQRQSAAELQEDWRW